MRGGVRVRRMLQSSSDDRATATYERDGVAYARIGADT
jgi:hypothetical protein